jgi:hypothetical protein
VSFGALFDPLSAPKLDPGKYLRSPWTVDEKCITGGVNVGSRWGSKFGAYSQRRVLLTTNVNLRRVSDTRKIV